MAPHRHAVSQQRLQQLYLNYTRVQNMAANLNPRYVVVNIPAATIEAVNDGMVEQRHTAVVGRVERATPIMASKISQINFNPYWHVPDHLIRQTIAKRVQEKGASYLKQNGYQVVADFGPNAQEIAPSSVDWKAVAAGSTHIKMRQLPGPTNSMGKMKFNFANPEGIYLHDTPTKAYFAQSNRTLSNGCIRLEDAKRLGRWLLGREPVAATGTAEQHVSLPQGIPVYVTYLTAQPHIGEQALVRDVYGWDARSAVSTAVAMQAAGAGS